MEKWGKKEFDKFLRNEPCTIEEFRKAVSYAQNLDKIERFTFEKKIYYIIIKSLNRILSSKEPDLCLGKNIYSYYGMSDKDFEEYLCIFLKNYAPQKVKESYQRAFGSIPILPKFNKRIFEEAKNGLWTSECIKTLALNYQKTQETIHEIILQYYNQKMNKRMNFFEFKRI